MRWSVLIHVWFSLEMSVFVWFVLKCLVLYAFVWKCLFLIRRLSDCVWKCLSVISFLSVNLKFKNLFRQKFEWQWLNRALCDFFGRTPDLALISRSRAIGPRHLCDVIWWHHGSKLGPGWRQSPNKMNERRAARHRGNFDTLSCLCCNPSRATKWQHPIGSRHVDEQGTIE